MFTSFLFHIVSAWFAFLLPCFATYKALSRHSEPDIEKWCMYWSVVGALVGFEYLFEWVVSWFPFYWEVKTLLLLFLALPQTQGSTWLYKSYLEPYFIQNEASLDAGIVAAQTDVLVFVQTRLLALWELIWAIANKSPATGQATSGSSAPVQSPLDTAKQLFSSYAPGILGSFVRPPAQPHASSSSFQSPVAGNVYQRSAASTPSHEAAPPFPEPQIN